MTRSSCVALGGLSLVAGILMGVCGTPLRAEETLQYVPRLGVWADTMALDGGRAGIRVVRIDLHAPAMYLRDLPREFAGPRRFMSAYRDVILELDGQRISRVEDLNAALYRAGEEARLTIYNRTTKRETRFYVTLP